MKRLLGRSRQPAESPMESHSHEGAQENLLIISDLHLGEACKEHSRIEYLKRSEQLDGHIVSFLRHHAENRLDEKPWCLILGGDLLDFLQVTMVPDFADEQAQRYGLDTQEEHSVWKFRQLVARHRGVFVHLADFVGRGHRLELIQGNHDEELFWPQVQVAFTETLLELYYGDERCQEGDREAFMARVHFNHWFYYVPDILFIEHGHRFDEYCATPPQLCPIRPYDEDRLVQPVSALAIKYFANRQPGFQTHDKEHWGILDYYRFFKERSENRAKDLIGGYIEFAYQSVKYSLAHGRYVSDAAQEVHKEALAQLSDEYQLPLSTLEEVDNLSANSVMANLVQVCATVCIFEVLAGLSVLLSLLVILFAGWGWAANVICVCSTAIVSFGGALWNRGRYDRNIREKLRKAAQEISAVLNVPIVCFGHSHGATLERQPTNHRAFYANSGSFLNHENHVVHEAGNPCDCIHTYLVIEGPEEYQLPRPKLYRWCHVVGEGHRLESKDAPNQR